MKTDVKIDLKKLELPPCDSKLFAATRWDAVPVAAALLHFAFFLSLFFLFGRVPLWVSLVMGFVYSLSISWNINGISHNFIHNPYFRSPLLNRLFSVLESVTCCFSQVYYDVVHTQHHKGNSDKKDPESGDTIDWISIYKHGHDDEPENVWSYTFLSFFRDNPAAISREVRKRGEAEMFWGKVEITAYVLTMVTLAVLNWRFIVYFLPFMYFGHCLSYLNGYYRHYGGNPDEPIAWGVSSYGRLYNAIWFNNGFHAEHHFRPRVHWTRMNALYEQIREAQRAAGVRVIRPPHALGFLDPHLPGDSSGRREPAGTRVADHPAAAAPAAS